MRSSQANKRTGAPHLVSSRRWCPWLSVSPPCFCEAFWLGGACRPPLRAPPTSRGKPRSYAPLASRGKVKIIQMILREFSRPCSHRVKGVTFLPSGGSKPLGPVGWNPVIAHSIIFLFNMSTDLEVSLSSLSGQAVKAFPARLLATCTHVANILIQLHRQREKQTERNY